MYSNTKINVTYFVDTRGNNTGKVVYGRVSEAVKTGRKDEKGKDVYSFESWNARFVGKAKEKAEKLADKSRITLTQWSARVDYNKETKKSYPYLMVMDIEIRTHGEEHEEAADQQEEQMPMGDFMPINNEVEGDEDIPF